MRLFGRGTGDQGESEEARQRCEASRRSLEQGGLPLNALDRLQDQAYRQGTPRHLFTSDLSVNELGLVREAGYEPLGQVLGSSVYLLGWQYRTPNWRDSDRGKAFGYEMEVVTQGFSHARHLALGRMRQEATLLGATGVVGVRLEHSRCPWGEALIEFAAVGTAVREVARTGPRPPAEEALFLSNLSGQEFWALRQRGYRPVGLAVGNCAYYQIPSWATQRVMNGLAVNPGSTNQPLRSNQPLLQRAIYSGSWQTQELTEYSEAVYQARKLAMRRLEAEARSLAAEGVVQVEVNIEAEPAEVPDGQPASYGMRYHFMALGTAIAPSPSLSVANPTQAILWLR